MKIEVSITEMGVCYFAAAVITVILNKISDSNFWGKYNNCNCFSDTRLVDFYQMFSA